MKQAVAYGLAGMIAIAGCISSLGCKHGPSDEPQITKIELDGQDPKAFADAQEMLQKHQQASWDRGSSENLISSMRSQMQSSANWQTPLWSSLDELHGVSISADSIRDLRSAGDSVKDLNGRVLDVREAKAAFIEGNRRYEAGKFLNAVDSYRSAIRSYPLYKDAWNNMALAEMHAGNDTVAVFEFSALLGFAPKYLGAHINLSVCLKRLGLDAAGYKEAKAAAHDGNNVGMAAFNVAWFEHEHGNNSEANSFIWTANNGVPNYTKARWLGADINLEMGIVAGTGEATAHRPKGVAAIAGRSLKGKVVTVNRTNAVAYSGSSALTTIAKGTKLTVSETQGEWLAFYSQAEGVKHRMWIRRSDCTE